MAISPDAGETWERVTDLLDDRAYDYTNLSCTFLADGRAAVTYWAVSPPFSRDPHAVSELRLLLLPAALTGATPR